MMEEEVINSVNPIHIQEAIPIESNNVDHNLEESEIIDVILHDPVISESGPIEEDRVYGTINIDNREPSEEIRNDLRENLL